MPPMVESLLRLGYTDPFEFIAVREEKWPPTRPDAPRPSRVWLSVKFLAVVYREDAPGVSHRVSINRVEFDLGKGRWEEGISWDDLQLIKAGIGFGDRCAVEIFPPDHHVVDVANMRHLWILKEPPVFMWKK